MTLSDLLSDLPLTPAHANVYFLGLQQTNQLRLLEGFLVSLKCHQSSP